MKVWFALPVFCLMTCGLIDSTLAFQDKSKTDSVEKEPAQDATPSDSKPSEPVKFTVADGQLELQAPGDWKKVEPAVNMIEAEFSIEPIEGDKNAGRLTVMGAGGSVEANIDRWIGQVIQPDGSSTRDMANISEKKLQGCTVHVLDVSGTYLDQRGPQAPKVEQKGYRLLAAIIETDSLGSYFVKLYGPEKTIAKQKNAFVKMVEETKIAND